MTAEVKICHLVGAQVRVGSPDAAVAAALRSGDCGLRPGGGFGLQLVPAPVRGALIGLRLGLGSLT